MKLSIILICIVALIIIVPSYQIQNIIKKATPKASTLSNQFGLTQNQINYGPEQNQIDVSKLNVRRPDGSWTSLKSAVASQSGSCKIEQNSYYLLCNSISDCGLCGASPHCGWCSSTSKCLPGSKNECACEDKCPSLWFYQSSQCNSLVTSGKLSNIAPDSKGLINPEIAQQKVVQTVYSHEHTLADVPVVLGVQNVRQTHQFERKSDGVKVNAEINVKVPLIGSQQMPVHNSKVEQKVLNVQKDQQGNTKLVEQQVNDQKVFHGVDTLSQGQSVSQGQGQSNIKAKE